MTTRRRTDPIVGPASSRWVVAGPVIQFAAVGLTALAIVALATATASRRVGQREAITDARTTTLIAAQGSVEPVVTNGLVRRDPAAVDALAKVVQDKVLNASVVRVKIWSADGTIVYSDETRLLGAQYELGVEELDALATGRIKAEVSDLEEPENRYERRFGKLLEVYLPVRAPDGTRLLFEAYHRYDAVAASGRRIWGSFAPVTLGGLIVLELIQIPLAWSLARRLRQQQRERELFLRHALEASDIERRRVAADLHDGVVQELVGTAYSLAAASRESPTGNEVSAAALEAGSESIRSSISQLRSLLVDIYPPNLDAGGLAPALRDLGADLADDGLNVMVDVEELPSDVPRPEAALIYRAAREALRNVRAHAQASTAGLRASGSDGRLRLSVTDDGIGLDPATFAAQVAEGHLGLKGIEGLVRDAGGSLHVESEPDGGTTVIVEVPYR